MQAVQAAQATLDDFDTLPPLGQDAVSMGRRKGQWCWDSLEGLELTKPEQILSFASLPLSLSVSLSGL